jgi:hypothetical protein
MDRATRDKQLHKAEILRSLYLGFEELKEIAYGEDDQEAATRYNEAAERCSHEMAKLPQIRP